LGANQSENAAAKTSATVGRLCRVITDTVASNSKASQTALGMGQTSSVADAFCPPWRTGCGRICFRGRKVNLSHAFAGQGVGVTQVGERIWLVTFMHYDLGYFDDETCRLEPIENPFCEKLLPIRSE
jgi:hypothetical protein